MKYFYHSRRFLLFVGLAIASLVPLANRAFSFIIPSSLSAQLAEKNKSAQEAMQAIHQQIKNNSFKIDNNSKEKFSRLLQKIDNHCQIINKLLANHTNVNYMKLLSLLSAMHDDTSAFLALIYSSKSEENKSLIQHVNDFAAASSLMIDRVNNYSTQLRKQRRLRK